MTDTVSYTDSTPPADYTGTMNVAIAGITSADPPRVMYALYEDATTWNAYYDWAKVNAFVPDADVHPNHVMDYNKYSSRVLKI